MNEIEKRFAEEKERLESVTAPVELEGRLRQALDGASVKKRLKPRWLMTAVALLFFSLVSYNYNGLAYYGKKIMGFEELMNDTLAELNEEGMGQTIGKKVILEDGSELTVDGIMTDANQLILYYTLTNIKDNEDITFASIKGFLTDSFRGAGSAIINDDEIKGEMIFDPVSPFAKRLTLEFTKLTEGGNSISNSISFPYDPNQAMQTEIRKTINKTVKVDKGKLKFKTITATPTMTMIKGTVDVENLDRIMLPFDKIELLANGKPIEMLGAGVNSSLLGKKFELRFDSLPKEIDTLELVVREFVGYSILKEKVPLDPITDQPYEMNGYDVWVKKMEETDRGVEITVASDQDVLFDGVSIEGKGGSHPLITTLRQDYEAFGNERVLKVRTLLFEADELPDYLLINGMHHMKPVGELIEIPVK